MAVPWNAVAEGARIVVGLKGWFDRLREQRDARQALLRRAELGRRDAELSVAPVPWIAGSVRTGGVVLPTIVADVAEVNHNVRDRRATRVRNAYQIAFLSRGEIAGIGDAWANDVAMPLIHGVVADERYWGSVGWTAKPRVALENFYLLTGGGPLKTRFDNIMARMGALVPAFKTAYDEAQTTAQEEFEFELPSDVDPFVLELFVDLRGRLRRLLESAKFGKWADDRRRIRPGQTVVAPLNDPAVELHLAFGTEADSGDFGVLPPNGALQFARDHVPGWLDSDRGRGLAWMVAQVRFWPVETSRGEVTNVIAPWASVPSIEVVVKGAGDLSGNAGMAGRWLHSRLGYDAADMQEVESTIALAGRPAERVPMAVDDAPRTDGQITGPVRLAQVYPDGLPSPSVQALVLNELNARETGPENATLQYEVNHGFTDDEINFGAAKELIERAMQGRFVYVGRKVRFMPGQPREPKATFLPPELLAGPEGRTPPEYRMARVSTRAVNAVDGIVQQDRNRSWKPSGVPRVQSDTLVERDGLLLQAGYRAPGQNARSAAMRYAANRIDHDDYGKRESSFRVKTETPGDVRGKVYPMEVARHRTALGDIDFEIESWTPEPVSTGYVGVQTDPDVYAVKYFPTTIDADGGTISGGGLDLSLGVQMDWRQTTTGLAFDVGMQPGADVTSIEVRATWRKRDPDDAEEFEPEVRSYVLTSAGASASFEPGTFFIETVRDQAVADPLESDPDVAPWYFAGDFAKRALDVEVVGLNGEARGAPVQATRFPPVGGGVPVTFAPDAEPLTEADGSFGGWRVTLRDIKIGAGSLVLSWTGGGANGMAWAVPSEDSGDRYYVQTVGDKTNLVIPNTFELRNDATAGRRTVLTLGASLGSGPEDPPFVAGQSINLSKYLEPDDIIQVVDDVPLERGRYDGKMIGTLESEA